MFVSVTLSCLSPCTFVYLSVRYVCLFAMSLFMRSYVFLCPVSFPCFSPCTPMSASVLFVCPVSLHALYVSICPFCFPWLSLSLLALLCLPLSCLFVLSLSIHSYVCLCPSAFGLPLWCMFVSACVVCFGLSRHRPLYNCIELYYTDVCGLGHSLRLI